MGAFSVDLSSQYARLLGCLESETAFSTAENLRPSTRVRDAVRRKRRGDETEGGEGNVGMAAWASQGLGIGRGMEVFVVVIVGNTGDKGPNTHWVHGENIEITVNM